MIFKFCITLSLFFLSINSQFLYSQRKFEGSILSNDYRFALHQEDNKYIVKTGNFLSLVIDNNVNRTDTFLISEKSPIFVNYTIDKQGRLMTYGYSVVRIYEKNTCKKYFFGKYSVNYFDGEYIMLQKWRSTKSDTLQAYFLKFSDLIQKEKWKNDELLTDCYIPKEKILSFPCDLKNTTCTPFAIFSKTEDKLLFSSPFIEKLFIINLKDFKLITCDLNVQFFNPKYSPKNKYKFGDVPVKSSIFISQYYDEKNEILFRHYRKGKEIETDFSKNACPNISFYTNTFENYVQMIDVKKLKLSKEIELGIGNSFIYADSDSLFFINFQNPVLVLKKPIEL